MIDIASKKIGLRSCTYCKCRLLTCKFHVNRNRIHTVGRLKYLLLDFADCDSQTVIPKFSSDDEGL